MNHNIYSQENKFDSTIHCAGSNISFISRVIIYWRVRGNIITKLTRLKEILHEKLNQRFSDVPLVLYLYNIYFFYCFKGIK